MFILFILRNLFGLINILGFMTIDKSEVNLCSEDFRLKRCTVEIRLEMQGGVGFLSLPERRFPTIVSRVEVGYHSTRVEGVV